MALPSGVYRITQWPGSNAQPQILSVLADQVTVVSPGAAPERDQEWSVKHEEGGLIAIQIPANIFPSRSLSFEGEPEEGKRIQLGPVSDFPTRKWLVEPAPQKPLPVPYFIRVPDTNVGVAVSPLMIYPPQLALTEIGSKLDNAWVFELLRPQ